MNILEGIMLGVLQGLTEFLPVSSSGHLVIAQGFIAGFRQPGVLFDVILHFGTLIAVLLYFRKDIGDLLKSLTISSSHLTTLPDEQRINLLTKRRWCWFILLGTVVTGVIGFSFKNQIEKTFFSPVAAAWMLLITGILLFLADRVKSPNRSDGELNLLDTISIGVLQGISLIPGISRSGSTIACGLMRGLNGETSARFSFLLSIPAISGVTLMELKNFRLLSSQEYTVYILSMLASCLTGLVAIKLLLILIKKRNLKYFSFYCWFLGVTIILYNLF